MELDEQPIYLKDKKRRKTMNKKEYANDVIRILKEEGYENVRIVEKLKENGVVKTGVALKGDGNIETIIYIENTSTNPREMAEELKKMKKDNMNMDWLTREYLLENVVEELLNKEKNLEKNIIKKDEENGLVRTFYVDTPIENGVLRATDDMCSYLNVTRSELYENARKNTENKEAEIKDMGRYMEKMMGVPEGTLGITGMYIVTNKEMVRGAVMILNKNVQDKLKEELGDYYVLPSSRHEVIIVPKENYKELREIVRAVNRESVAEEDFLSNEVYEVKEGKLVEV